MAKDSKSETTSCRSVMFTDVSLIYHLSSVCLSLGSELLGESDIVESKWGDDCGFCWFHPSPPSAILIPVAFPPIVTTTQKELDHFSSLASSSSGPV